MSATKRVASVAIFPAVLFLVVASSIAMLAAGSPPWLPAVTVQPLAALTIVLCERWLPYCAAWNRQHGDLPTDILHGIVTALLVQPVASALVIALVAPAAGRLAERVGAPIWPTHWPLWLQLPLALLVAEFGMYWLHRWQHEHEWLWRWHAVHHSAPRLYWLNATRFHPVDIFALTLVGLPPLVLLGCPEETFVLAGLVAGLLGAFQHANIELKLGPLNYVFSLSELHRWHHSKFVSEANCNYGGNLIVWDILFGTRCLPKDRVPSTDIGVSPSTPAVPARYLGQLYYPFVYGRHWKQATCLSDDDAAAPVCRRPAGLRGATHAPAGCDVIPTT